MAKPVEVPESIVSPCSGIAVLKSVLPGCLLSPTIQVPLRHVAKIGRQSVGELRRRLAHVLTDTGVSQTLIQYPKWFKSSNLKPSRIRSLV